MVIYSIVQQNMTHRPNTIMFLYIALLGHSHTHLGIYCLWLLSHNSATAELCSAIGTIWPVKSKVFTHWPFTNFVTPLSTGVKEYKVESMWMEKDFYKYTY